MKLTIILSTLAFIACNSIRTDETQKAEKFQEIKRLTKLNLPFSNDCGVILKVPDQKNARNCVSDIPNNLKFGGLLKVSKNYAAIILLDTQADQQIHYLTTISNQGEIIEKLNLFSSECNEDEFTWGQASYVIDKDLKIWQTDSSAIYERTESGKIINEATISSFHNFEFKVDADGKIIKYSI